MVVQGFSAGFADAVILDAAEAVRIHGDIDIPAAVVAAGEVILGGGWRGHQGCPIGWFMAEYGTTCP